MTENAEVDVYSDEVSAPPDPFGWASELAQPVLAEASFGRTCQLHGAVLVLFDDDPLVWVCECPRGTCKYGSAPGVGAMVALGHGRELPPQARSLKSVSLPDILSPSSFLARAFPAEPESIGSAVVPRLLQVAKGLGVTDWLGAETTPGSGHVVAIGLCLGVPTCIFAPFLGAPPIRVRHPEP